MSAAIRVLVVDDSVVIRRLLSEIINGEADMEVVATASNGALAIDRIHQLDPDVITLDVEMPDMDGIATLREMRAQGIRKPTIMFSTLTERGAAATLDAMALGASDYVTKPSNTGSFDESRARVREELVPKVRALGPRPASRRSFGASVFRPSRTPLEIMAIGCSTGGPNALAEVIPTLPADLHVPVVVVQHMPPIFTGLLARRLNDHADVTVVEAEDGMPIEAATVYIAPGDHHLLVDDRSGRSRCRLTQDVPENSCRPAVDPLFRSVAKRHGDRTLAVILTGMGHDGLAGCEAIKQVGGEVYVQDEPTSVVWGMPGAVANASLADAVLPLSDLGPALVARATRSLTGASR